MPGFLFFKSQAWFYVMPSLCCRNLAPADRVVSKRQSSAHICARIAPRSPEEVNVRLHQSLAPSAIIRLELASMANVFKNESFPSLKNVETGPKLLRRVVVPVMPSTRIKILPGLYRRSNCLSPPLSQVTSHPDEGRKLLPKSVGCASYEPACEMKKSCYQGLSAEPRVPALNVLGLS